MTLGTRRPARQATQRKRQAPKAAPENSAAPDDLVTIERLSHDGRGVARDASGKTIFVDGALAHEQVRIRRHRQRGRFDEAHVVEIERASRDRVTPECQHIEVCGGCTLQHLAIDAQRRFKQQVLSEHLAREGVNAPESDIIAAAPYGYRRRARLGVKVDSKGAVRFGFRRANSERLFDISECPVLEPELNALLEPLKRQLEQLAAPRLVGHVELLHSATTTLRVHQLKAHADDQARWQRFAEDQQISLEFSARQGSATLSNNAASARLMHYPLQAGEQQLDIGFKPGDFIQVNGQVNQALVSRVLALLNESDCTRVLDLFAGVGNFSLPLAANGFQVRAIEGSDTMVQRLLDNASASGLAISAEAQDLNHAPSTADIDAVVLDPPRDGAQAVASALALEGPRWIAYVSCNPATLSRDARILQEGGYRLTQLSLVDMFPHTAHLESLSLFVRH
ncbi:23S rRNA (uracil(1939)-C(5))-methyltransferase RlmD [Carnimonas bestiolae]|uniref:23S rRNA (uracil(1939)-C(5))-methyltransferase RlmD n=1 Tax=Carnimonas bestiolae TaxID=3402172 RepID=UPI003EDBA557